MNFIHAFNLLYPHPTLIFLLSPVIPIVSRFLEGFNFRSVLNTKNEREQVLLTNIIREKNESKQLGGGERGESVSQLPLVLC